MVRTSRVARVLHKWVGYSGALLTVAFVANGLQVTLENGVAGKVVNNGLPVVTGTMMLWHLYFAVAAIRRRDLKGHIEQAAGLLCWVTFPAVIRAVAVIPFQYLLFDARVAI